MFRPIAQAYLDARATRLERLAEDAAVAHAHAIRRAGSYRLIEKGLAAQAVDFHERALAARKRVEDFLNR